MNEFEVCFFQMSVSVINYLGCSLLSFYKVKQISFFTNKQTAMQVRFLLSGYNEGILWILKVKKNISLSFRCKIVTLSFGLLVPEVLHRCGFVFDLLVNPLESEDERRLRDDFLRLWSLTLQDSVNLKQTWETKANQSRRLRVCQQLQGIGVLCCRGNHIF